MKIISLIIPHYNNINGIKRLINTIPLRDDLQVIVVDDKSNKDVKKILESFLEDKSILLLTNENDNSAGTCRNIGISKSVGKYVLFADDDDYFIKEDLNKIIDSLYSIDNVDMIYYPTYTEKDLNISNETRGKTRNKFINSYHNKSTNKRLIRLKTRTHGPISKIILMSFLKDNNIYFDDTLYSNDVMFSLKAGLKANNIKTSTEKFYLITNREGSLTNTINLKSIKVRDEVYKRYILYLKNYNEFNDEFKIRLLGLRYILRSFKTHKSLVKIFKKDIKFLRENKIKVIL